MLKRKKETPLDAAAACLEWTSKFRGKAHPQLSYTSGSELAANETHPGGFCTLPWGRTLDQLNQNLWCEIWA